MTTTYDITWNIGRAAAHLRHLYQQLIDFIEADRTSGSKRPSKGYELASARHQGACGALHAIGLGMTPFAVEQCVLDGYREQVELDGKRPDYHPANNEPQRHWDTGAAAAIARRLRLI